MKPKKHDYSTCMCHVRFGKDNAQVISKKEYTRYALYWGYIGFLAGLVCLTITYVIAQILFPLPNQASDDTDVMCKTLFGKDYWYIVIDDDTACVSEKKGAFVLPRNTTTSNTLQEIGGYPMMAWPV